MAPFVDFTDLTGGGWDDPELAEILRDDPDLYDLARTVRAARPEPVLGPHFEPYLRAKLMDAAARELRPRGISRWLRPRPSGLLAGGGAALGLAMIAAVVATTVLYHPNDQRIVTVSANVAGNPSVLPNDVIRVAFSTAVDHSAVESNLHIHPATTVQTRWDGNTLVITPVHHLAANTPYSVTIPRTAVRDAQGHTAGSDVHIAFGTASTPTPSATTAPAQPPVVEITAQGPVDGSAQVLFGPDGSVVATAGLREPAGGPSPAPSASAAASPAPTSLLNLTPTPRPGHNGPSPTPLASASAAPAAPAALLSFDSGQPAVLGPAALTARFSPNGRWLAYLAPHGDHAWLTLASADGSHGVVLTKSADPSSPLAWTGSEGLVYLSGGHVMAVDLEGRVRTVSGSIHVATGQDVLIAPGGAVLYVGPLPGSAPTPAAASPTPDGSGSAAEATPSPENSGHLVDLATGAITPLQGIRQLPAFSGDGTEVAWVDESGGVPVLAVMPVATGSSSATVSTSAQEGDALSGLGLDQTGAHLVYTVSHGDQGSPDLRVVTLPAGDTVAVGDGQAFLDPVLSADGSRIAFLRPSAGGVDAMLAVVPGSTPPSPAPDAVPADAGAILNRFVDAQSSGSLDTLRSLAASSLTIDASLTPSGVTRAYVIKATFDPATGVVEAQVRLVRDVAHASSSAAYADETVRLARPAADAPYAVIAVVPGQFQSVPSGPQIVHVTSERQLGVLVIRVAFDSDLDASTVAGAVRLLGVAGVVVPADTHYEVESRTVVIRVRQITAGPLSLLLSTSLHDVDGQALGTGYSTTLQG